MAKKDKVVDRKRVDLIKVETPPLRLWDRIRNFFSDSETIFLARLEVLVGFLVSAFALMDWGPLLAMGVDTGINWVTAMWLGGLSIAKGIVTELGRRHRATDV